MISSHITKKEASKQNVLYPIGYTVITMLIGYMTSMYHIQSPKGYGIGGHTQPQCPLPLQWLAHCPWCGKEDQNEGTVVNHLWTVHYRLGLVCNKCYSFPSTSSDTLCHHGQQNCLPSGEGDPNESASSE